MTSISSIDIPTSGGNQPSSPSPLPLPVDLDRSQGSAPPVHPNLLHPLSLGGHPIPSRSSRCPNPPESKSAAIARNMSAQSAFHDGKAGNVPRLGAAFMCDCCPKKPKKFDTEEELRYVC
jgi:hypothetical protein